MKRDDSNIKDVCDGALYQKEFKPGGFLSEPYNISVKLNTDGVAIFHSSQFGVWPLFLPVNELPPAMRRNNKFRVFGGLWFGEEKPFFSKFLKPFVNTLQETEINRIEVVLPDGLEAKSKIKALSSHFDLPACTGVLEQVSGFKSPSPLLQLPSFDTVNGIATEYRNWLFFYSLPCMKGVLDDEYYQHYALLVGGIVLLSGRSISPEQLELAGNLLIHFVEMLDAYYGSQYVLMNQHMLLHLKESVLNHGPLWSSSLFVFEDWNGDISNYFHGTQNIAGQIMTAVTSQQQLPELIKEMPPGSAKDLVMRLLGQHTRSNKTHLKDDFYVVSALKSGSCTTEPFVDDLQAFLGLDSLSSVKFFTRLKAGSTVFHLKQYKRVSRRNTFTVAYRLDERHSLEYGQIEIFFKAPVGSRTSCGAVFKPLSRTSKGICEQHKVLGRPVSHIIALHHPHRYLLFPLKTLLISVFIWHFQTVRCIMQLIFPITWNKILIVNY